MRDHGGQLFALAKKLQIDLPLRECIDFSASINPLGMPPALDGLEQVWRGLVKVYPDPDASEACQSLALAHGLQGNQVLCGNGSMELFVQLLQASGCSHLCVPTPCWSGYGEAAQVAGVSWGSKGQDGDCFLLASPNNPDGVVLEPQEALDFCTRYPRSLVIVDLAFDDFLHSPQLSPWWTGHAWPANLVLVKSLTKFFAIPGVRLGFLALSPQALALPWVERLRTLQLPWSVNGLAQWSALRLYGDHAWMELARSESLRLRQRLVDILSAAGCVVRPCAAWVLAEHPRWNAQAWQRELLRQGIGARLLADSSALRFGLRSETDLEYLRSALLGECPKSSMRRRITPALLVAGCTSDAGKSALATGICASLHRRGLRPMPYKAQNMSNHAWVTPRGGEIGWAQAVQAFAAQREPHVDMNPVLLKPGLHRKSHVVHCGIDQGARSVQEYHAEFSLHRQVALDAYDRLAAHAGHMVLEGAGGLGETNLRHRDLSNREAPLHANARILLVADIDRGGAFASLYGTWACLDPLLRQQVVGFAINRFRGDASLLDSGIVELRERTGLPTLGVLPHRADLDLGSEDSLGLKDQVLPLDRMLRIGVVRLPHLSNINDWAPLQQIPGVGVFLASDPHTLAQADALILPGTRTTIADLRWLRQQGIDRVLLQWVRERKPLLAICGGMQMLGVRVTDPEGVEEGEPSVEEGLAVLPIQTEMRMLGKVVQARSGLAERPLPWMKPGLCLSGYEIHCGHSQPCGSLGHFQNWNAGGEGWCDPEGLVWATYWHGILHSPALAEQWVHFVAQRCGKVLPAGVLQHSSNCGAIPSFLLPGIAVAQDLVDRHLDLNSLLSGGRA